MTQLPLSDAYLQRFNGIARLYGRAALDLLAQAHFVVVGLGGVGSWAAEALARTGIGHITLIDLDEVCVSNTNRQLHTLASTVGQAKTKVMAQRLLDINPEIELTLIDDFAEPENIAQVITREQDLVIDAIDAAYAKAALIAHCKRIKVPIICVGSSGGKRDPRLICNLDLAKTTNDPLLARTRNNLRRNYGFTRNAKRNFSIEAIYSTEQLSFATPDGGICENKAALVEDLKLDCSGGLGAATMVTASFGLMAASRAVDKFLHKRL